MYCSGCGHALVPGQPVCPQCGRPAAAAVPSVPGLEFLVANYAAKLKTLSIFWFIYAGLSLTTGIVGLAFAHAFMSNHFGMWGRGPWMHGFGPEMFGPMFLHFAWVYLLVRSALALAAGWALMEHSQWGRVIAIVAAIFNLLKFPFGTAMGIWTLVVLLGYRNTTLYEQLP